MFDNRLSKDENEELMGADIYDIHDIFNNVEEALAVMSKNSPKRLISDIANDIEDETFVYPDRLDDIRYRTYQYRKFKSNRIAIIEYY